MELSGATAVVTGAASGLGAATAEFLAERGMRVLGIDLSSSISKAGEPADGVRYAAADVTSEDEVRAALSQLSDEPPLRVVVNCAGVGSAERVLSSRGVHDLAVFQRTVDINLVGSFNVLRLTAEIMADQEPVDEDGQRGVVVNTASIAAFEGQIGQIAYAASKGGVVAMGVVAAQDLARNGIRVNTIAPGVVATPMFDTLSPAVNASLAAAVAFPARLGKPREFAQLVAMIAEHDYLNGETIRMDGALRMGPR